MTRSTHLSTQKSSVTLGRKSVPHFKRNICRSIWICVLKKTNWLWWFCPHATEFRFTTCVAGVHSSCRCTPISAQPACRRNISRERLNRARGGRGEISSCSAFLGGAKSRSITPAQTKTFNETHVGLLARRGFVLRIRRGELLIYALFDTNF